MKEITLDTKIADLLNDYEGMKDILIEINPKFKKLNNPVLRRTIAKVAGVKQAAIVGGMDPLELLNKLRSAVGQSVVETSKGDDNTAKSEESLPQWVENVALKMDANKILDEDKNPLVELHKEMKNLNDGDVVLIESDFQPEPLIDEYKKSNHDVFCQKVDEDKFFTYVKK